MAFDDAEAFSSFAVRDLAEAERFYRDVLGLRTSRVEGMEEHLMALHAGGGHDVMVYDKGAAHAPAGFTVLNFRVRDAAATADRLEGAGVVLERYPDFAHDERGIVDGGGVRIGWFTDPSGNVLSFLQIAAPS